MKTTSADIVPIGLYGYNPDYSHLGISKIM